MKICTKCKAKKPLSEYYKHLAKKIGYTSHCKECIKINAKLSYHKNNALMGKKKDKDKDKDNRSVYFKEYYNNNKEKYKDKYKEYYNNNKDKYLNCEAIIETKKCSKCKIEKTLNMYHKNNYSPCKVYSSCRDCVSSEKKEYYLLNKYKIDNNKKLYRNNSKLHVNHINKLYREKNKNKIKIYNNKYKKDRMSIDSTFKIKHNVSCRIRIALKSNNLAKNHRTDEYLGISYDKYKVYLERKFEKGMTWGNWGEWHIDHIIPLSSAANKEELKLLFHYTNTQPLWADENLTKHAKMPENVQIKLPI